MVLKNDAEVAFTNFVTAHHSRLYAVARSMTPSAVDAQDVVQEALIRVASRWGTLHSPERYAGRVVARLAIDDHRRRSAQRRTLVRTQPQALPDLAADVLEQRSELVRVVSQLPTRQRQVIVLGFLCDMSVLEVATALRCGPGTVKRQTSDGLAALRRRLASPDSEGEPRGQAAEV
jgi:RNA polymerase sigma factor (sigma-70 family)